jgi:Bacteriophage tail sheath protein
MGQYLSPGVYVEEVAGTPPIVGVGTSTVGFIGEVANAVTMPALPDGSGNYTLAAENAPCLVTNWTQFITQFGDFQAGNKTLAHGVYGFFNNGGTRCWIARVTDITDQTKVCAALAKFEAMDDIAIVAAPGARKKGVQTDIITHCSKLKSRFAILDGLVTTTITPASINGGLGNSDYAAMYFPQIQVYDPVSKGNIYVPPSGHVAGIYARVDATRGVHKAPANEVIQSALGLEYSLTKGEQDGLNPDGINAIRNMNGNIRVWGARTLGGDANGEYKYINVRRLLIYLRESIDRGTQFVVFEPNAQPLWKKIIRSVSAFLTNVWRDGALFGVTPEQAFYVKCDETTNPPEVRDLGQVVTEIGVAVVKPAEFVIFRISQISGNPS